MKLQSGRNRTSRKPVSAGFDSTHSTCRNVYGSQLESNLRGQTFKRQVSHHMYQHGKQQPINLISLSVGLEFIVQGSDSNTLGVNVCGFPLPMVNPRVPSGMRGPGGCLLAAVRGCD